MKMNGEENRMKRQFVLFLCFLLSISVVLSACSKSTNQPTDGSASPAQNTSNKSGEKATLNVALWDENVSEVMKKSIEIYKKNHPNVDVKVTYTPWAD
jgi:multiple sugar transport system substrate-binding protein